MLTPRENFLETIRRDGKPDRLVNQYEALAIIGGDPIIQYIRGPRYCGMPPTVDRWGVTYIWPEDQLAALPDHIDSPQAITDVTAWKDTLKAPDLSQCAAPELWEDVCAQAAKVDRSQQLVTGFMPYGTFELLHSFMGFETTLISFLTEPEAMAELCEYVGEFRLNYLKLMVERLKPEAMLFHDDWGAKTNLFMSPETWRTFLKPQYEKLFRFTRENGILSVHHADSFLEPIVPDMAEMGIDVWQGVLPENDILRLQKQLDGRMALMGGIDVATVDRMDSTEAEIRGEVRRACETYAPGGHYIPSLTYGGPSVLYEHARPLIRDEIERYNLEYYGIRG